MSDLFDRFQQWIDEKAEEMSRDDRPAEAIAAKAFFESISSHDEAVTENWVGTPQGDGKITTDEIKEIAYVSGTDGSRFTIKDTRLAIEALLERMEKTGLDTEEGVTEKDIQELMNKPLNTIVLGMVTYTKPGTETISIAGVTKDVKDKYIEDGYDFNSDGTITVGEFYLKTEYVYGKGTQQFYIPDEFRQSELESITKKLNAGEADVEDFRVPQSATELPVDPSANITER